MRPVLRRGAFAAACLAVVVLGGCGKHVASNAPITFAPADTPYVLANFKAQPADIIKAWSNDSALPLQLQPLGDLAKRISDRDPTVAKVLQAVQAELANVRTTKELTQAIGLSQAPLYAMYGIGDVPVARIELASPDTFKAFWQRVEKRAGITTPTATLDQQTYWVIGGADAKVHVLVAIEGQQLVATVAPANASPDMLKQLLGLTKPASDASDRLAGINSRQGYSDYGSGYVDLPKLFDHLFDGKDAVTQAFARELGVPLANPACASEFRSVAQQVPLVSTGVKNATAKAIHMSVDAQLSSSLAGALTALKQPVPGMDEAPDHSMFDMVLALPVQKWQAFLQERARTAAEKTWQCPALQALNKFARTAAHPPVPIPPEAASLLGFRFVLDQWEAGPQIAGRVLVASSNPAALAQKIQQTLPQFALKTIPGDGKPVAFELPSRFQAMLGGSNQGWIAANADAIAVGVGAGEEARLSRMLVAPPGNGDRLLRLHFDGKMYGVLGNWLGRFAAMSATGNQAQAQQMVAVYQQMAKMIESVDMDAKLDDHGLHLDLDVTHR